MALLRGEFYSKYLGHCVPFTAVIPADKMDGDKLATHRRGPYRTVYLLHGLLGHDTDWIDRTQVIQTAEARDLCVIMPSGEDGCYINRPEAGQWYGKFVSEELVEFTRRIFPLSAKREDTCLAGISLGAYSATVNALVRPDRFGSIIALSGTYMRDRVVSALESGSPRKRRYYERYFGDLNTVLGTEKDYVYLAELFRDDPTLPKPRIYAACGHQDSLVQTNRDFVKTFEDCGFDVTYHEPELGAHEWPFWKAWIDCALDWFAPGEMKPTTAMIDYSDITRLKLPEEIK